MSENLAVRLWGIDEAISIARRQHETTQRAWQEWEHLTFGTCPPPPTREVRLSAEAEAWETWLRATFPEMN